MRKLPVWLGLKTKLADSPGFKPRVGSGVDHDGSMGLVERLPVTTAHEFGIVPWFKHWIVIAQPTGTRSTSEPSE
jgi:hypothetical protein